MRTRVKFCGLVQPEDVDAAVAIGADAVGFVFYPKSARHLRFEEAAELRRLLPSWVRAVGLFVNAERGWLLQGVREVGLDVVQAHGDEQAADLADLPVPCWKALRIGGPPPSSDGGAGEGLAQGRVPAERALVEAALGAFDPVVEACLVDSVSQGFGGSGHAFDWSVLPRPALTPLVLAGGLRPDTVGRAITEIRPFAVDVSSGIQADDDARRKDVIKMEGFMAAVLAADARHAQALAAPIERGRG